MLITIQKIPLKFRNSKPQNTPKNQEEKRKRPISSGWE
jgi:hypothetical protein